MGIIRAVYFDAVGTLIHPAIPAPRKYAELAAARGIALSESEVRTRFIEAFREQEEFDRDRNWETSEEREIERWRAIVTDTLGDGGCFDELYQHYAQPVAWTVDPDAINVFEALSAMGMKLGMASNYDSRLDRVVEGHDTLRRLRPNIVISSQVGIRKPAGGFFEAVARSAGVSAEEILYLGDDRMNDFEGARSAGFRAVLLDAKNRHDDVSERISSLIELINSKSL